MSFKRWVLAKADKDEAAQLAEDSGIHPFLIYLLTMRGIHTVEEVSAFLLGQDWVDDPFVFADMELAVARIQRALDTGEEMAVFGDYDADGVTATVLLYTYLRDRGGRVSYLVPEREGTGYGMHPQTIDEMHRRGVTLIITVDNGISAVDEVEYARQQGIDVVITDHHMPQERLPRAVAVVDPHREDCPSEFKQYAGVGVAFKLACALEGDADELLARYADLIAIGTLAD
ncbi:MAG: DHH family phosphoesterase, partial [Acutalibacteraceae bacterium]